MRTLILLLPVVALLAACGDETPRDPENVDHSREIEAGTPTFGIYNALKAMGAPVEVGAEVEKSFFDVPGRALVIGDQPIELYEFDSRADADEAAAKIASDGSVAGALAANPPVHWFRSELVLVLYRGSDQAVLRMLETTLGGQFAGAR
jgi:hypothetical protein